MAESQIEILLKENAELKAQNAKQKETIEKQWKLLEQCGVSAGGELKRVSYLLEKLREENERLKNALVIWENAAQKQTALKVVEVDKYRQTLQEIKEIIIQEKVTNNKKIRAILDLITKAESEE